MHKTQEGKINNYCENKIACDACFIFQLNLTHVTVPFVGGGGGGISLD